MRLNADFFDRDCLEVAPDLIGKILVRRMNDDSEIRVRITESEAYRGEEDTACHASKGRTTRTNALYQKAGTIYIYLCYGIHWLLNVVTGEENCPQAVLLRCGEGYNGPAKLTKRLMLDKSFNCESFVDNSRIWIEDDGYIAEIKTDTRVGINYASEEFRLKQWRFVDKNLK